MEHRVSHFGDPLLASGDRNRPGAVVLVGHPDRNDAPLLPRRRKRLTSPQI